MDPHDPAPPATGNAAETSTGLRAEAVAPADLSATVESLYLTYLGRHATALELAQLGSQLASGARTLDQARVDLVGSADGRAYLTGAIGSTYQSWAGRAAAASEVAVWVNEMTIHGATLATVRNAILTDPAAQAYSIALVTQAYQQWGGRAPTATELSAWQNMFLGGLATPSGVASAVQGDPLGIAYATGIIQDAYRQWGGREATSSDIGTWLHVLQTGGSFDAIKAGILAAPLGLDHTAGQITQAYQQWGGRAPTADEIGTWQNEMRVHGATIETVRLGIIRDPLGIDHLDAQIAQVYQEWGGRAPTGGELATWRDTIALHGGTLATVKMDILADAMGEAHARDQLVALFAAQGWGAPSAGEVSGLLTQLRGGASFADAVAAVPHHDPIEASALARIYDGYAAWLGRAPTATEVAGWQGQVQANGTGVDALHAALSASGEGQVFLAGQAAAEYQAAIGRAPSTAETAAWVDAATAGGTTLTDRRAALFDTPDGHAAAAGAIAAFYQTYYGRAATPADVQAQLDQIAAGRSIAGLARDAFTTTDGILHFRDELSTLSQAILGRDPTAEESSDWFGKLYAGATYDTMRATLMAGSGSSATRVVGTIGDDRFALDAMPSDAVVSAFDPAHDRIVLAARYAGSDLFDAHHARDVVAIDGDTPGVLLTLDDQHHLLIEGMTLARLNTADFLFG